MHETHERRPEFPRWLIAAYAGVLAVLLSGGVWFHDAEKHRLKDGAESDLDAIVRLKADQISRWRAERLGDGQVLAESPLVSRAFASFMSRRERDESDELLTVLRSVQQRYHYSDILLADARGVLRTSLSGFAGPLVADDAANLSNSLRERNVLLSELHTGPGGTAIYLDVVAPILDLSAAEPAPLGAIILRADARDFLFPLIQAWPTASGSAETVLVRREGENVLYLSELRNLRDSALRLRIPLSRTDVPAVMAVMGKEGIAYGKDYRGAKVMAAMRRIPGSSWVIVAKEGEAEVLTAWRVSSALILALFLGLAGAGTGAFLVFWQRHKKSRYMALFEAETAGRALEERSRLTLMSVGDGVIATDAQGTVRMMNPAAEALTGWAREEATGRPLEEVFRIIQEETRQPVEDPVGRVVREGRVRGFANHTLLLGRDGKEHSIADTGAAITSQAGKLEGIVLVFRDVTRERLHESEHETTMELLRLLNVHSETEGLIRGVTGLLHAWTGCEAVGIRLQEGDDYPYFETRGFPGEFVQAENYLCEREIDGRPVRGPDGKPVLGCMCGTVLRRLTDPSRTFFTSRGSFWTNSTTGLLAATSGDDERGGTLNRCNSSGYESVALIPLRSGEEVLGLLQLNDHARGRFTPSLVEFLESAADQIAIALAQHRAGAALHESEAHYHSLFENMLNGFAFCRMIFDNGQPSDFIYLDVNGAFEKLTGLKDVVGRRVSEVIPGIRESDPELLRIYGRVARGGAPERFETHVEGLGMWFSISVYCPRPDHFVAIFDVITERKRAEAGRQLLASAVEQAAEMIVITDPLGAIQYVNPAFEAVTGYSRTEVIGRNPRLLNSGQQDAAFYKDLWETITGGRPWKGRFVNKKKDGTLYSEDAVISPVVDGDGRIVNFVADKHDSTRELQLESQLLQAQKMESVGRLAGGVAHDFNNMLHVISSYVEISLKDPGLAEPQRHYVQQIRAAASRSAALTSQLLAFARKQAVSPKIVDLNEAVVGTMKMLQRLIGEDIELVWRPGRLSGRVRIDPAQLDQILANLSVNASDAIAGVGTLTLETAEVDVDEAYIQAHVGAKPGRHEVLIVSDTGAGMSQEVQAHIFEPFFTTKPVGQGTGLGLATVYGIVKQNDGFINVYSEPGYGTSFRISFPHVADEKSMQASAPSESSRGGSETILFVEDEQGVLEVSKVILESFGYRVLTAGTPGEAISQAEHNAGSIDILITDVIMPQMNGRDLSRRLLSVNPRMKCLFISGYTADVIGDKGLLDEGVHFLSKPFTTSQLASKIREVLDGGAREP